MRCGGCEEIAVSQSKQTCSPMVLTQVFVVVEKEEGREGGGERSES